jgi:hypothetical protein
LGGRLEPADAAGADGYVDMRLVGNRVTSRIRRAVPDGPLSIGQFVRYHKTFPRLRAPRTFNEKLLWLKLHHRDPLLHVCADKLRVRDYVRLVVSEEISVPLLGVYEHSGEIAYDRLPDRFVLKPNHGSKWVIFCLDRQTFDRADAAAKLDAWMKIDYYWRTREWAYKGILPRRILCEEFLTVDGENPPPDYKFWCFNGKPKYVQVDRGRFGTHKYGLYDVEWNKLPFSIKPTRLDEAVLPRPATLPKLLNAARNLAAPFPFVRVDLFAFGDRVYFGELTFIPRNVRCRFRPKEYDLVFGDQLVLPARRPAMPSDASGMGDGV